MAYHRSGFTNLLLVLGSLVFTLALLEGGSRVFYLIRWNWRLYPIHGIQYSLRLGWEMAPGSHFTYQINAQGFRRPDAVSLARSDNVVRIFIIGGSTAFGMNGFYPSIPSPNLAYEDTIDYHLQTLLRTRHPDRKFEVINAAVPEYRLFQEITLFLEKLVSYDPNLVIFLDGHNDASFLTRGAAVRDQPAPYWDSRHVARGERALNPSPLLGPLHYADIYLGRVSYFYHGLGVLLQRYSETTDGVFAGHSRRASEAPFRLEDEPSLLEKSNPRLRDLDGALPLYVAQVKDLKAVASARKRKILYALQPEAVVENPGNLTEKGARIQDFTFRVLENFGGTLSWRYLIRRIPEQLYELDDRGFRVVNLTTIADGSPEDLYTDYTHLTSRGNQVVAEKLYPEVIKLLELQ